MTVIGGYRGKVSSDVNREGGSPRDLFLLKLSPICDTHPVSVLFDQARSILGSCERLEETGDSGDKEGDSRGVRGAT